RAAGLPAPPPVTSPTPSDAVSGSPQAPSIPPGGQSAPPPTPESATAPAGSRSASSLTPGSGPADSRSASPSTPGSSATPEGMPTDHATAPLDAPASSQPGHEAARPSVSGIPQAGTTPASLPPGSGVSAGQPRPVSHDEPADGRAGHRAASSESAAARSYRTGAVAAEARRRDSAVSVAVSPPEPGVGEAEGRLSGVPAEGSPAGAGTAGKERAAARSYGPEVVGAEGPFSVPAEKADPPSGPGAAGKGRAAARSYGPEIVAAEEPVRVSAEGVPAGSGAGGSGGRADGIGVLVARAREGGARVVAALEDAGRALGTALAGAVNLLDPAAVVLGGAYAELGEWLVPPMRRELAARVTVRAWDPEALTVSELGRRGPLLGAALATVRSVLEDPASLWA